MLNRKPFTLNHRQTRRMLLSTSFLIKRKPSSFIIKEATTSTKSTSEECKCSSPNLKSNKSSKAKPPKSSWPNNIPNKNSNMHNSIPKKPSNKLFLIAKKHRSKPFKKWKKTFKNSKINLRKESVKNVPWATSPPKLSKTKTMSLEGAISEKKWVWNSSSMESTNATKKSFFDWNNARNPCF